MILDYKKCSPAFIRGFALGIVLMLMVTQGGNILGRSTHFRDVYKMDNSPGWYCGSLGRTRDPKEVPIASVSIENDDVKAEELYKEVRVLCWIMTSPGTLQERAKHVRDTWAKRCNVWLFMSSEEDKNFPAVGLPVEEGRDQLYEKTKAAFKYVWEHHKDDADWFLKADDDTFVIVENLRFLLKDYDTKKPIFFGRRINNFIKEGYMSGGAGYVLSKEALSRYVVDGLGNYKCPLGGTIEDAEIGKCLVSLGVSPMDARDGIKMETFHPLGPKHNLLHRDTPEDQWLWGYDYYPNCMGPHCCTDYPITYHYVSPEEMLTFYYMVYGVKIHGYSNMRTSRIT